MLLVSPRSPQLDNNEIEKTESVQQKSIFKYSVRSLDYIRLLIKFSSTVSDANHKGSGGSANYQGEWGTKELYILA